MKNINKVDSGIAGNRSQEHSFCHVVVILVGMGDVLPLVILALFASLDRVYALEKKLLTFDDEN